MGGKRIKVWSQADQDWLRERYIVNVWNAKVYIRLPDGQPGSEVIPCKVGPLRKQYLAVGAVIGGRWTKVRLHMLVWFFATGKQSMKMIDHIEGEPVYQWVNRIDNLREATDKQNCANKFALGYREYVKADGSTWYFAAISWTDKATGKRRYKRSPLVESREKAKAIYHSWKKQRFGQFAYTVSAGSTVAVSGQKA